MICSGPETKNDKREIMTKSVSNEYQDFYIHQNKTKQNKINNGHENLFFIFYCLLLNGLIYTTV